MELLVSKRDFEKYATGCHLSSSAESWDKTAPVAKFELSASMWKGWSSAGVVSTGAEVTDS